MKRPKLRWRRLALWLLGPLLIAGHIAWWYLPRERALIPSADDLPGQLLRGGRYDVVVWLPYPHQNLGAAVGDAGNLVRQAGVLAEQPNLRLPSFGPFDLPPARELVLASDLDAGRFVLAARVYPLLAGVARLAGKMAANPWLQGGEVSVAGQPAQVSWQGSLWTVSAASVGDPQPAGSRLNADEAAALETPLLGAVRIDRNLGWVPAGLYPARREGRELTLHRAGAPVAAQPPECRPESLLQPYLALLLVSAGDQPRGDSALALFNGRGGQDDPAAGADGRGFALMEARQRRAPGGPGIGLAAILGPAGYSGRAAGWQIQANVEANFLRAAFLAPQVAELLRPKTGPPCLRLGLVARPAPALEVLADLEQGLQRLPGDHRDRQRQLQALLQLLSPLTAAGQVSLLRSAGGEVELRLTSPDS